MTVPDETETARNPDVAATCEALVANSHASMPELPSGRKNVPRGATAFVSTNDQTRTSAAQKMEQSASTTIIYSSKNSSGGESNCKEATGNTENNDSGGNPRRVYGRGLKRKRGTAKQPSWQYDQNQTARKFACPFFKHDPEQYKDSAVCSTSGWQDIARLK